jgi:hypothetical protein
MMRPEAAFFLIGWIVGVIWTWAISQVIYTLTKHKGH